MSNLTKSGKVFIKTIREELVELSSCEIQHTGWPCNTCFHSVVGPKLGLSNDMTHELWKIILVLRGDYTEKQIQKNEDQYVMDHLKGIVSSTKKHD